MEENRYELNSHNQGNNNSELVQVLIHTLLMVVTCGLYYFYWVYKVTKFVNEEYTDEKPLWPPLAHILLMFFFQPYSVIWSFLVAARFKKAADYKGMATFNGFEIAFTVLSIILPFLNFAMLDYYIEKYKRFEDSDANEHDEATDFDGYNTEFTTVEEVFETEEPHMGAVEEIRQYKELLDQGIITQEEFDAKKKQILDL